MESRPHMNGFSLGEESSFETSEKEKYLEEGS